MTEKRGKPIEILDRALERGLEDVKAGRTHPAEELRARFTGKSTRSPKD
jgi:predicted transcriptional regulator